MNKEDINEIIKLTRLGLDERRKLEKHKQRERHIQEALEKSKNKPSTEYLRKVNLPNS